MTELITTPIWSEEMMKQRDDICPVCDGWGYTDDVSDDFKCAPDYSKNKATSLGSGCFACRGTGKLTVEALKTLINGGVAEW